MLNQHQLAQFLQVHYNTIARWRQNKKIPALKIGRQYRYDKQAVLLALGINL